ncbi:uncharacterized protein LOC129584289 [Paramacrobiotus metropolitanus]|uniref:uncharacterized protein LOC129584289 n=1 Tax=Paramacrobiotus metropolitanus TaxID=2943436 RepID=UPI0024457C71|nr:uncharacterized protein LOC129584289 [Paramacrobiotus metropolitanus]
MQRQLPVDLSPLCSFSGKTFWYRMSQPHFYCKRSFFFTLFCLHSELTMFDSKAQFTTVNFLGSKGMMALGIIITVAAFINSVTTIVASRNGPPELIYPHTPVNPCLPSFLFVLTASLHFEHCGFFARQCTKHMTSKHMLIMRGMFGLLATLSLVLLLRTFDYALISPREPNYFQKTQALMDKQQAVMDKAGELSTDAIQRKVLEKMQQYMGAMGVSKNDTAVFLKSKDYERAVAAYLKNWTHEIDTIMTDTSDTDKALTSNYNDTLADAVLQACPESVHSLVLALYGLTASIFLFESVFAGLFWVRLAPYGVEYESVAGTPNCHCHGKKRGFLDDLEFTKLAPAGGICIDCSARGSRSYIIFLRLLNAVMAGGVMLAIYSLVIL